MFLIQPNCPGCILHGIPIANAIASSKNRFDTYCVATAFEDFEYNTIEGTQNLLEGRLYGASSEKLGSSTENIPTMPVAFDCVVDLEDASEELKEETLAATIESARGQLRSMNVPEDRINQALCKVGNEALPPKIAEVFWTVRAQGTPTWVVHRANGEILGVHFGFMSEVEMRDWVNSFLEIEAV